MAPAQSSPPASQAASRSVAVAYGLLTFTAMIWAGNAVAGKWAVGQVSPLALTSLRWLVACVTLVPLAARPLSREWRRLLPNWRYVLLMGGCGYTAFNGLFYVAGTYTSTTNLALIQGAIPVMVLVCSFLAYRTPVGPMQAVGVLVTLVGVVVAATHGDPGVLRSLAFNRGDLLMLAACLFYAGYTVALRRRPAVSGLTFFAAMALAAFLTSLPLVAVEWANGDLVWPTGAGWVIVAYVGLGPSLVSQLTFLRGVGLIGPNRAGMFVNLIPVFGAVLAVVLVGEPFRPDTAVALALVLGGIVIAERLGVRRQAASP